MLFENLAVLSAFPIVQLKADPATPQDGLLLPVTPTCRKHLQEGKICHDHYRSLAAAGEDVFVQCPFGFTTMVTRAGAFRLALTGVIAHPRFQTAPIS